MPIPLFPCRFYPSFLFFFIVIEMSINPINSFLFWGYEVDAAGDCVIAAAMFKATQGCSTGTKCPAPRIQ